MPKTNTVLLHTARERRIETLKRSIVKEERLQATLNAQIMKLTPFAHGMQEKNAEDTVEYWRARVKKLQKGVRDARVERNKVRAELRLEEKLLHASMSEKAVEEDVFRSYHGKDAALPSDMASARDEIGDGDGGGGGVDESVEETELHETSGTHDASPSSNPNAKKSFRAIVQNRLLKGIQFQNKAAKLVEYMTPMREFLLGNLDTEELMAELELIPDEVKNDWLYTMIFQLKKLGKLLSLNDVITKKLDNIQTAMEQIVDKAIIFLDAERGTVFAVDADTRELFSYVRATDEDGAEKVAEEERMIRIPETQGIAGFVFTTGQTVSTANAYDHEYFSPEVDERTGQRTENLLCVPVSAPGGYRIGVLQVINKIGAHTFNSQDEQVLQGLAVELSVYLFQAQTYEEVRVAKARSPLIQAVMEAFATEIRLAVAMDLVVQTICDQLDVKRATVFVVDEERNELFSRSAAGTGSEIRFPANKGLAGECFTKNAVINIPDAYQDKRFNAEFDRKTGFRTRSILCLPILNGEGVPIGVIQAINKCLDGETFSEEDVYYGKKIAIQAGFSLEYARLYEQAMSK